MAPSEIIRITEDPQQPVEREVLAEAVLKLSRAALELSKRSGLNQRRHRNSAAPQHWPEDHGHSSLLIRHSATRTRLREAVSASGSTTDKA